MRVGFFGSWPFVAAFVAAAFASVPDAASADHLQPVFSGRVELGPSLQLGGEGEGMTISGEVGLGASIYTSELSSAITDTWGLFLNPELGWATTSFTEGEFEVHLFHTVFGVGYGHPYFAIDFRPRFLVGAGEHGFAIGLRHGVGLHALFDIISVEIGYQFLVYDGLQHTIEIYGGINMGTLYELATGALVL